MSESFEALFEESLKELDMKTGSIVTGTVVDIDSDWITVNAGLKSEAVIPRSQFINEKGELEVAIGDETQVSLEAVEDGFGETKLSREKAKRAESWIELEKAFDADEVVLGIINGKVKGGFTVELKNIRAFLPGSLVDTRPVRDTAHLEGKELEFKVIKLDAKRNNVVVSRRAILEAANSQEREELLANLQEGQSVKGIVKNLTDYGAFVDLGGVDGLLHITDIAWRRINHPSEALHIGQTVKVQVIRFNPETQRISLGMKQLEADPWEGVELKYPAGAKFRGRVTNITDYGAFVELEPGVEGLVHVSEMSWTKKNVHPGKIVSTSQEVEVMVLEVDPVKRRISLGLKHCMDNPWTTFSERFPPGTIVEGEIKNITEFGLFIGLDADVDGMVHMSDLDWSRSGEEAMTDYQKGQVVKAQVLDVDTEKERISLGIKQLGGDPMESLGDIRKGAVVTCMVTAVTENGLEVTVGEDNMAAFIRRAELARDRGDQRPERFSVGDKVDARVTQFDRVARKIQLSIKALEIAEEKEAVAQYGSSDSGASLGDILGAALKQANSEDK